LTVDTIDPIDPQKTCPLTPKGFTQPIQGAQLSRPTEAPLRELHSRGNNCRACDIGWWFLAVQPIPPMNQFSEMESKNRDMENTLNA